MKKCLYELLYRIPLVPIDWIFGSTSKIDKLVQLAVAGRIESGSAITLGCSVGREAIYLANNGFAVIGLDFSSTAIKGARRMAQAEGVKVKFVVDDLANLQHFSGTFDLITDNGVLNDMSQEARDLYVQNMLPLTHPGSYYLQFCFYNKLSTEEVRRRFGEHFRIEELERESIDRFPGSLAVYLTKRRSWESGWEERVHYIWSSQINQVYLF